MKTFIILFLSITLISCGQIGAFFRSTDHFSKLESDNRILYETDALDIALQVAKKLDYSIETVEKEQSCSFVKPVAVYVCASEKEFSKFTGLNQKIKAAVFNEKIFLSGSLRDQPSRIPTLTTHELSHLHLIQKIGTTKYVRNVPSWFSEGLAVFVSNGGGAENVSETEAAHAILDGFCFHPDVTGSILFPKTANSYNLKPHMFYRQSAMFVQFLKEYDSEKFEELLKALQSGEKFSYASFGKDINTFWEAFEEELIGIGSSLTATPSHTTRHTDRVPRRFG